MPEEAENIEVEEVEEYDDKWDKRVRGWCKAIAIGLIFALVVFLGFLFMTGEIYSMRLI